jgi:hypothetical protein
MMAHATRRIPTTLLLTMITWGCTVSVDVPIQIEADLFPGEVIAVTTGVGSCPATRLPATGAMEVNPNEPFEVPANAEYIAAWVVTADCQVRAFACTPLDGSETVQLTPFSIPRYDRCPDRMCVDGACGEPTNVCADDGLVNPNADTDGDGESNQVECGGDDGCGTVRDSEGNSCLTVDCCDSRDTDGDEVPDYRDPDDEVPYLLVDGDADGDGLPNGLECDGCEMVCRLSEGACSRDSDGDGTPDYLDGDSDGDGLSDAMECASFGMSPEECAASDLDGDGFPPFLDVDADGDGARDGSEGSPAFLAADHIRCEGFENDSWIDEDHCGQCGRCQTGGCSNELRCVPALDQPTELTIEASCDSGLDVAFGSSSGGVYSGTTLLSLPVEAFDGSTFSAVVPANSYPSVDALPIGDAVCRVGVCVWLLSAVLTSPDAEAGDVEPIAVSHDSVWGSVAWFAFSVPTTVSELERLGIFDDLGIPDGILGPFVGEVVDRGYLAVAMNPRLVTDGC